MFFPAGDVIALGAGHSSLGHVVDQVATGLGLQVSPDPMPEQNFFIRSDQYSFVRQGVPALFVDAGTKSADPKIDGMAVTTKWLESTYHTPKDDVNQAFDLESGAKIARLHFLIGAAVADAPDRPTWNEGDFFGKIYGGRK